MLDMHIILQQGVFSTKRACDPIIRAYRLLGSFLSAGESRACYSSWSSHFTVLVPGLQCSLLHGLWDNREHWPCKKKKKQIESSNIKVTKATHSQKFNRQILLSLTPRPTTTCTRFKRVLQLEWLDWIQERSGAFHSTERKRSIRANFQHITTNKALPATITKTVISSHWNTAR